MISFCSSKLGSNVYFKRPENRYGKKFVHRSINDQKCAWRKMEIRKLGLITEIFVKKFKV